MEVAFLLSNGASLQRQQRGQGIPLDPDMTRRIEQWHATCCRLGHGVPDRFGRGPGAQAHEPRRQDVRRVAGQPKTLDPWPTCHRWSVGFRRCAEVSFWNSAPPRGDHAHLATSGWRWHVGGCVVQLAQEGWKEVGCDTHITAKQAPSTTTSGGGTSGTWCTSTDTTKATTLNPTKTLASRTCVDGGGRHRLEPNIPRGGVADAGRVAVRHWRGRGFY